MSTREEVSIVGILAVLMRRRRLVLVPAGIALLLAVAIPFLRPRTWTVQSSFLPQSRRTPTGAGLAGLVSQLGVGLPLGDAAQTPAFYADLLVSSELLGTVVRDTIVVDGAPRALLDLLDVDERTPALAVDAGVRELRKKVSAMVTQKTGVVALRVQARYPEMAYEINRRLLDALNRFNLENRQSQAAAERRFTGQRLDEVRQDLRQAEDRLQAFLQRNRDYRNSPELAFQYDRLARDVSMRQTIYTTLAEAFEQARIEEVRDTPVITEVERPALPPRPDRRRLASRGILALVLGGGFGMALAVLAELLAWSRRAEPEAYASLAGEVSAVVSRVRGLRRRGSPAAS